MGTGYNTEVTFSGVRYHVQTEDKGGPRYEIVSHIYQGGAILLTKRLSYGDRPDDGDRAVWTQEMTAKQHKDILKVIQQGGVDLLRVYIARDTKSAPKQALDAQPGRLILPVAADKPETPSLASAPGVPIPGSISIQLPTDTPAACGTDRPPADHRTPERPPVASGPDPRTSPLRVEPTDAVLPVPETLGMRLLNPGDFRAGRALKLKVLVTLNPTDISLPNVKVIVQIFGMSFRPILFSGRTDASGFFTLDLTLPNFSNGQAALNILAVSEKFGMSELKYAIKRS